MAFEQEIAAFDRFQPDLNRQYGSQYIAIYKGGG